MLSCIRAFLGWPFIRSGSSLSCTTALLEWLLHSLRLLVFLHHYSSGMAFTFAPATCCTEPFPLGRPFHLLRLLAVLHQYSSGMSCPFALATCPALLYLWDSLYIRSGFILSCSTALVGWPFHSLRVHAILQYCTPGMAFPFTPAPYCPAQVLPWGRPFYTSRLLIVQQ